jgi:ribonuclease HI
MGGDIMRPAFNLEPKYRVTVLTREEWNRGPGTPPEVQELIGYTDGSTMTEGTRAGVYGQSLGRRLIISLGKYDAFFQAEVYAILACVYEIQTLVRPEKNVSICSDSQVALQELQVAKTTSPLVQQCPKVLNDISLWPSVEQYWVPGHARVCRNEITDNLARGGSVQKFVGPELSLGVSRQNMRDKIKRWVYNQHLAMFHVLGSTQRQAQKLISGPSPTTKTRLLSFNRTQSRVVTGRPTGHTSLRKHLYLMGLINNATCRKCGTEEETSVHPLCECEVLASRRPAYLCSFFLDPEDIKNLILGAIWNFSEGTGLP